MLIDFWFGYEWSVGGGNAGRFRGGGQLFCFCFRFFLLFFLLASFEPLSFNSCSVQATLLRMDYYRLRFS